MKLLRNGEIKKDLWVYTVGTLTASLLGFCLGPKVAVCILGMGILCAGYHFWVTWKRYQRLARLSEGLDRVLHEEQELWIEEYTEGELAILENELRKMLLRLKEQTEALRQDKVFLADLIADISHQIRTPLTSLRLFCSLMQKSDLTEEKRLELVRETLRLLGRMDWLIESLLKMSKLDSGTAAFKREPVLVEDLIFKASELVAIPMELREQKLEVEMSGQESYLGDLSWSVEAIGNILKNCMEHMENGQTLKIAVQENPLFTEIRIQDQGPGLEAEDLKHLFERFYRGKHSGSQSIGIGLALARAIIKEQNGTVKAENAPEGGALFTIRFYKSTV